MPETRVKSCVCLLNWGSGWRRARWQAALSLIIVAAVVIIVAAAMCDEAGGGEGGYQSAPCKDNDDTRLYYHERARGTIPFDFAAIRDSWIQM